MDDTRRAFLKKAGAAAIGAGCALPLLGVAVRLGGAKPSGGGHASASAEQYAFVIDARIMTDSTRKACADACHLEHNVPTISDTDEEVKWMWSIPHARAFPEQVHAHTPKDVSERETLVLCNHCTNPACVKVCPTGATWKRESDGIVMMDMHRCIGCRYCMAACPYGARSFNWSDPRKAFGEGHRFEPGFPTRTKGVVEKCNFCAERLRRGGVPACVEPSRGAIRFNRLSDPDMTDALNNTHTIVRKGGLGTGPNIYYIV